jgi:release factor glutamine methyltransferase
VGTREAALLAHLNEPIAWPDLERFRALVARRLRGEPVAYLLGEREFWGRPFSVDSRVLIPRPETEHLIEEALRLELPADARVVDIGTGSGCLAVTASLERPNWRVTATDLSLEALAVARRNAAQLGATSVRFAAADLAAGLQLEVFDLVLCNPPYVDPTDAVTLPPQVTAFEPARALFADQGGLAVLRELWTTASRRLNRGARLVVELGAGQAESAGQAARDAGLRVERVVDDLRGIPRVLVARRA